MYRCPLCNQEVDKLLYEKITGLWKERQRLEADLKLKAKNLSEREQKLRASFALQKKNITTKEREKYQILLTEQRRALAVKVEKERNALIAERRNLAAEYNKKIANETKKIITIQKAHYKEQHDKFKQQFEQSASKKFEQEKEKIESAKLRLEKEKHLQTNRYIMLNKQFAALQSSSGKELEKRNRRIESLEQQIKSNQTPQVLGLLEEGIFLGKLQELFPHDKFDHPGKGGDIIHHIIENTKEIGLIVYELKKVNKFSPAHIEQAYSAKQQRRADYGILVTNAKRNAKDSGFSISKSIIIIHPAGALVLVGIIRDHLITMSRLKLSKQKREATINAVLDYIQSPTFKNGIDSVIQDTIELYTDLQKEVKEHLNTWAFRFNKYRNINSQANRIESRVINLLITEKNPQEVQKYIDIKPIELPSEIE